MDLSIFLSVFIFGILLILTARRMPAFFMGRPVTLGMVVSGIALFGIAALIQLPVELMPNVSYGNVTIFINVRGGMPPPEVERLVTKPVEDGMGTVSHLRNLISTSKKERSIVTLEFESGTDMDLAVMEVREKFFGVKPNLPPEIEKPVIARYEESDAPIYIAALTSKKLSPEKLREYVDSDLKRIKSFIARPFHPDSQVRNERPCHCERSEAISPSVKHYLDILQQNQIASLRSQ